MSDFEHSEMGNEESVSVDLSLLGLFSQMNELCEDEYIFDGEFSIPERFMKFSYDFLYDKYYSEARDSFDDQLLEKYLAVIASLYKLIDLLQDDAPSDDEINDSIDNCKTAIENAGWKDEFETYLAENQQPLALQVRKNLLKKLEALKLFVETNEIARKDLSASFPSILSQYEDLQSDIRGKGLSVEVLSKQIASIKQLMIVMNTPEVEYQYELEELSKVLQTQGYASWFARSKDSEQHQKSKEVLHQVDDLEFRNAAEKQDLSATLRATRTYLEDPSDSNLLNLHDCVKELPADSNAKFYLTATLVTIFSAVLIAGVVAASIYYPTAAQLFQPMYTSCANFFVSAGMQTAFVVPHASPFDAGNAVPVWSLVAGGVAGGVVGVGGSKIIEKTAALHKLDTDEEVDKLLGSTQRLIVGDELRLSPENLRLCTGISVGNPGLNPQSLFTSHRSISSFGSSNNSDDDFSDDSTSTLSK